MRPLLIDDEARERARRLKEYADAHPYIAGPGVPPPGPEHHAEFDTYRVTLTRTILNGCAFRHLSVSVPGDRYPGPEAVFLLADLLGFTGFDHDGFDPPPDWSMLPDRTERCVKVIQAITQGGIQ